MHEYSSMYQTSIVGVIVIIFFRSPLLRHGAELIQPALGLLQPGQPQSNLSGLGHCLHARGDLAFVSVAVAEAPNAVQCVVVRHLVSPDSYLITIGPFVSALF